MLAYVFGGLATRRRGVWAVLIGLADISETAWRQRLRAANPWLLWVLGALLRAPGHAAGPVSWCPRRVRVIDATRLRQPGGRGDDWRVHLSYDVTAGHMDEVVVRDQHSAERLTPFTMQPGEIAVGDRGYGYRSNVATAVQQGADVALRLIPATFPVDTAAGTAFDLGTCLSHSHAVQEEWRGWGVHDGQRDAMRVVAARLPPEAAARARQRTLQQAQKHGRTPLAVTFTLAEWVIVVTPWSTDWTLADMLRLYRARWAVELVCKWMKQLLRCHQLRSTHRTTVEAPIRALLIAWALQEEVGAERHRCLRALTSPPPMIISRWLTTSLGLDTLRQQVQSTWSQARLRACLPRLQRFLGSRPRRRAYRETVVRTWLEGRAFRPCLTEEDAA